MTCDNCKNQTTHRQASSAMTTKHGFSGRSLQPAYVYFSRLRERDCKDYAQKVCA